MGGDFIDRGDGLAASPGSLLWDRLRTIRHFPRADMLARKSPSYDVDVGRSLGMGLLWAPTRHIGVSGSTFRPRPAHTTEYPPSTV